MLTRPYILDALDCIQNEWVATSAFIEQLLGAHLSHVYESGTILQSSSEVHDYLLSLPGMSHHYPTIQIYNNACNVSLFTPNILKIYKEFYKSEYPFSRLFTETARGSTFRNSQNAAYFLDGRLARYFSDTVKKFLLLSNYLLDNVIKQQTPHDFDYYTNIPDENQGNSRHIFQNFCIRNFSALRRNGFLSSAILFRKRPIFSVGENVPYELNLKPSSIIMTILNNLRQYGFENHPREFAFEQRRAHIDGLFISLEAPRIAHESPRIVPPPPPPPPARGPNRPTIANNQ